MKNKKNNTQRIIELVFLVIEIIFLVVIIQRKYIFASDSLLFNLYEADLETNTFARILKCVVAIVACSAFMKLATGITILGTKFKNNKTKTGLLLLGNVLKYISAVVMIFVCLSTWGIDTTTIATGTGVITLIVGMGCQSMISDIVAGIFILFEGDIQVGDVVVISGWRGTVEQIGLRRTKIIDGSGNVNIINNSSISNVINNTRELSNASCTFAIDYNENIENVEKILRENFPKIKEACPGIITGPVYSGVTSIDGGAMKISISAKTTEQNKYQTERDINRAIKLLFDEYDIEMPIDQISIVKAREQEEVNLTPKEIQEAKKFLAQQRQQAVKIDLDKQNKQ